MLNKGREAASSTLPACARVCVSVGQQLGRMPFTLPDPSWARGFAYVAQMIDEG